MVRDRTATPAENVPGHQGLGLEGGGARLIHVQSGLNHRQRLFSFIYCFYVINRECIFSVYYPTYHDDSRAD